MGKLFDKLDHKDELDAWIKTYAGYENVTSANPPASLDYLMRYWEDAKSEYLYKMFGGQFIIEKTISVETPRSEIFDKMWTAMTYESDMTDFKIAYRDWLSHADLDLDTDADLWYLISPDFLTDNAYGYRTHKISINDTTITIQKGCKPMKALAKIAELAGLEGFEKFRIAHSNILNKKKTTGTLCLSIHPLDYITMSDNDNDWDSCMNWVNAGCYRIGTVEMMNSPAVVVAYLKSHKSMRFHDNEWNSKKWRNLFIVDRDFITGIKGYPYQDPYLDEVCIDALMSLAEKNLGYRYDHDIVEHSFDSYRDDIEFPDLDRTIDFRFTTNWMYNDFGNGNTTHMVIDPHISDVVDFCYSGTPECMYCGNSLDGYSNYDEEETSAVICSDCMQLIRCEYCHEVIPPGEECELDGQIVCSNCYESNGAYDPFSEETHDRENMNTIFLVDDAMVPEDTNPFESFGTFINTFTCVSTIVEDLPENIREKIHNTKIKRYIDAEFNWFEYVDYIKLSEIEDESLKEYLKEVYNNYGNWL